MLVKQSYDPLSMFDRSCRLLEHENEVPVLKRVFRNKTCYLLFQVLNLNNKYTSGSRSILIWPETDKVAYVDLDRIFSTKFSYPLVLSFTPNTNILFVRKSLSQQFISPDNYPVLVLCQHIIWAYVFKHKNHGKKTNGHDVA